VSVGNDIEEQFGSAAVIVLLVALAVGVAILVMGLKKFLPWLQNAWKKIFGAVPEWLKPEAIARWLAKWEMKLDVDAPLASILAKSSKDVGDLIPGTADSAGGVQVKTGIKSEDAPGPDSVESYGGE
jgi:hypothetical protein